MGKHIRKFLFICIGWLIIGGLAVEAEDRVVSHVEIVTDHSVKIRLNWLDLTHTTPIRITSWSFEDANTLVVFYQSDSGTPSGWNERMIEHTSYVFPMKIYLRDNKDSGKELKDLPSTHSAYGGIMNLYYRGIISGYPDGTFKGENPVSRAEFAKMLLLTADYTVEETPTIFTDVAPSYWGRKYIATLADKKILKGKGNQLFDPEGSVTLGEVMTVLSRTFDLFDQGKAYPYTLKNHWSNIYFLDLVQEGFIQPESSYYYPYVPDRLATREDCAVLLSAILEQLHRTSP